MQLTVVAAAAGGAGLRLTSIHDYKLIHTGKGCADTLSSGIIVANVTTAAADGSYAGQCNLAGTVRVDASTGHLVSTFSLDANAKTCGVDASYGITAVHSRRGSSVHARGHRDVRRAERRRRGDGAVGQGVWVA